ncbi:hypothetical protein D9Q98_002466 [Chlorella vulgaris]|uniref:tRNA (guanine(10)-N(2))-methyltransferase n=1 Tax=Chlorella vulgaris TaxID=3077 RepID=A0A9D4TT96_CHLVU|nr:hypothetical protein D9Q98_002466 [Chlorella vulgaris]
MTVIGDACPPASTTTPAPLLPPPEPAAVTAGLDEPQRAALPLGILNPAVIPYGSSAQHAQLLAGRSRYLCYFLHRHLEFRLAEVECLAGLVQQQQRQKERQQQKEQQDGQEEGREAQQEAEQQQAKEQQGEQPEGQQRAVVWEKPFENWHDSPLWYAHMHGGDSAAAAVAARSMLCRVVLELWGEADSLEELRRVLAERKEERRALWGRPDQSFKYVVETYGCSYSMQRQVELIESFDGCNGFQGPIDLRSPQLRFWIVVCKPNGQGLPHLKERYYFGREVGAGDRTPLATYDLRRRRYLGPTSMDTEMSFLMCNMAQVRRYSLVLDPFVGTGSVLVPATHLGALTLGADIDIRVIKIGKKDAAGQPVNIWTNFADYGLQPPLGLLRCDLHTAPFRDGLRGVLDAIVCDPPYGVRAGGKKSVGREREIKPHGDYVPSTAPYTVAECMHDLLDCAARLLVVGGRLAYWLPAAPDFYSEEEVPRHPALQLVANCEQLLSSRYSRRLIIMQKVQRYDAAEAEAYFEARGPPVLSIDCIHEHVYKTPAQLAADAGLSLAEHRAVQAARTPLNRGKNI